MVSTKLITIREAAERLGLKESTIRKAILKRQIAYVKPSVRAVRIPIEELERILAAGLRPVIAGGTSHAIQPDPRTQLHCLDPDRAAGVRRGVVDRARIQSRPDRPQPVPRGHRDTDRRTTPPGCCSKRARATRYQRTMMKRHYVSHLCALALAAGLAGCASAPPVSAPTARVAPSAQAPAAAPARPAGRRRN